MLQLYKPPNSSETHQCFCIFTTRLKNVLRGADCCQHKHCYPVQLYGLAYIKTQTCNSLYLPFCPAGTRFLKRHNSHVGSQKEAAGQHHQMLPLVLRRWILASSNALPGRVWAWVSFFQPLSQKHLVSGTLSHGYGLQGTIQSHCQTDLVTKLKWTHILDFQTEKVAVLRYFYGISMRF